MKVCQNCGAQNDDRNRFCGNCAAPLTAQPQPYGYPPPSKPQKVKRPIFKKRWFWVIIGIVAISMAANAPYMALVLSVAGFVVLAVMFILSFAYKWKKYPFAIGLVGCIMLFTIALAVYQTPGLLSPDMDPATVQTLPSPASPTPAPSLSPSVQPSPSPTLTPEEEAAIVSANRAEFIASCEDYVYKEVARSPDDYEKLPAHFRGEVSQVMEYSVYLVLMVNVTEDEYGFWDDSIYVQYFLPEGEPRILEDDIVDMYGYIDGLQTYTTVLGDERTIPSFFAAQIDIVD